MTAPLRHLEIPEQRNGRRHYTYCGEYVRDSELVNRPQGLDVTCPKCKQVEDEMTASFDEFLQQDQTETSR